MKSKLRTGAHEAAQAGDLKQESGATTLPKQKVHSPTPEQIRQRAFEIHKDGGGCPGKALDDWLQAEREFLAEQEHPVGFGNGSSACECQYTE